MEKIINITLILLLCYGCGLKEARKSEEVRFEHDCSSILLRLPLQKYAIVPWDRWATEGKRFVFDSFEIRVGLDLEGVRIGALNSEEKESLKYMTTQRFGAIEDYTVDSNSISFIYEQDDSSYLFYSKSIQKNDCSYLLECRGIMDKNDYLLELFKDLGDSFIVKR